MHLTDTKLIKILVNEKEVHVCAVPLNNYNKTYDIFYTVDGNDYHYWNDENLYIDEYENAAEIKNRLSRLYQYISEDELKKVSEESWE